MQQPPARAGYTLVETIVALLVFSVGGLALTSTSALIGRQLRADDLRERATRVAVSRLEMLRAGCSNASGGTELVRGVQSQWSATAADSADVSLVETVSYISWNGPRTDTYRTLVRCR